MLRHWAYNGVVLMRNRLFLLLLIMLISMTASCSKSSTQNDIPPSIDQKILFYYEYNNTAWGNQHHEYFIDNRGNVWKGSGSSGWVFRSKNIHPFSRLQYRVMFGVYQHNPGHSQQPIHREGRSPHNPGEHPGCGGPS